jgi:hypothetical protein
VSSLDPSSESSGQVQKFIDYFCKTIRQYRLYLNEYIGSELARAKMRDMRFHVESSTLLLPIPLNLGFELPDADRKSDLFQIRGKWRAGDTIDSPRFRSMPDPSFPSRK